MKRRTRFLACLMALCILVSAVPAAAAAQKEEIVILYENDVHCALDGYAKLFDLKKIKL